MPTIEKLSVALPSEMAALVRRAVDGGEYSSNSEVIRDALRDWTHKRNLRGRRQSPTTPKALIPTRSLTAWKANWIA
jgi:Arc/MetJ-type ribon-helix-helix transcriptional regulator